ncbi:MAG: UDP-glucose 6-dehydrogenase [Chloroflexi bacterium]|nr:UDP-glucose 6-dehydrogenase [Chloroflexota bacterium]
MQIHLDTKTMSKKQKICVIGGAGYVGLVTGLGLSEIGHEVINVDVSQERVAQLNAGTSPIYEEGIDLVLSRNLDRGRIKFSTDLKSSVEDSQVIFIAVGTPSLQNGEIDLSQIMEVANQLRWCINKYKVIAIKSTIPVGSTRLIQKTLREEVDSDHFDIVANPEFLREGNALKDFFFPDRIVLGGDSDKALSIMKSIYEPITKREVSIQGIENPLKGPDPIPLIQTDIASAQIIKYASNAFLATRISFINEIAGICEQVNADIKEVANGMGYDSRIGHSYLEAGLGFGGPCLEKDLSALINTVRQDEYTTEVLQAVLERNHKQVISVVDKVELLLGTDLHNHIIGVLGLTFKPGTNDIRNSLSIRIISELHNRGAMVQSYDPLVKDEVLSVNTNVKPCDSAYSAAQNADALLILTGWKDFLSLDYHKIYSAMSNPCIVDCRNLLDAGEIADLGFKYVGIGIAQI